MNKKEKVIARFLKLENDADRIKKSEHISNGVLTNGYKYVDSGLLQMWQENVQYLIIELYGEDSIFYENFISHKRKNSLGTNYNIFEKQLKTFQNIKENYLLFEKDENYDTTWLSLQSVGKLTQNNTIASIIGSLIGLFK